MTLATIPYLAWTARDQAFCVHPRVFLTVRSEILACRMCGAVLRGGQ